MLGIAASGLVLPRRQSLVSASSIFRANATVLARAEKAVSEERVGKLANQMYYNRAAKAGTFYGYAGLGYGGAAEGAYPFINGKNFSVPIWVVPYQQPRVKIWLVEEGGAEETLRTGEFNEHIQEGFNAVPLPTLSAVPKGRIQALGSDGVAVIWCPATDELWEMHRLGTFLAGAHKGEWKFGYGVHIPEASKWNGICPAETGQVSASHLSYVSGAITMLDLVKVARGGKIEHALNLSIEVTLNEHVAPATHNDSSPKKNTHETLEDEVTPNPAYTTEGPEGKGSFDGVPEGSWFAWPKTSTASEQGITGRLAAAIYEAGREYGYVVTDQGGGVNFNMADPRTLFTPYDITGGQGGGINPLNGSSYFKKYVFGEEPGEKALATVLREAWTDPTLTVFTGELNGTMGVLWEQPWRTLELLAPRVS